MDQGWPIFAITHDLQSRCFITFKNLYWKVYKVVIFNFSGAETLKRCPQHPEAFKRIVDDECLLCVALLFNNNVVLSK
jgi:hypothetical protein